MYYSSPDLLFIYAWNWATAAAKQTSYRIGLIATPLLNRAPGNVKSPFLGVFLNKTTLFVVVEKYTFWGIYEIEPHPKIHFEK